MAAQALDSVGERGAASRPPRQRTPAEWEHHDAVWIGFPSRKDTWRRAEDGSCPAQAVFAQLAGVIARRGGERVCLGASRGDMEVARAILEDAGLQVVAGGQGKDSGGGGDGEGGKAKANGSAKAKGNKPDVRLYQIEQDDSWFRDTGPCFSVGEEG